MVDLTPQEVDEVSGGLGTVAAGAIIGAIYGGFSYATSGPGRTWSGYALAIGSGAAGGAIAGMGGFAFGFYGSGLAAVGGLSASILKNGEPEYARR